jgi:hypothetical protein
MTIKKVYVIMYQYDSTDYSIIKIMVSLNSAYNYICSNNYTNMPCKLVELTKDDYDNNYCIEDICDDDIMNILYCNTYDCYDLETFDCENISPYIIMQMDIDNE